MQLLQEAGAAAASSLAFLAALAASILALMASGEKWSEALGSPSCFPKSLAPFNKS